MPQILLVEDDYALAVGLLFTFEEEGYQTIHAPTAQKAMEAFRENKIDLIVLDVMLPDGNGYALCKNIRKTSDVPIIFLTSCDDEVNIVMGLDGGGDDYVTKPFQLRVLMSRIKAQLRRQQGDISGVIRAGRLAVYPEQCKAYVEDAELMLTATEYRLLYQLLRNRGKTMTRKMLLDLLWDGKGEFVDDNTLSVHVRHLREKLSQVTDDALITTVRGIGYRLEVS